MKTYRLLTFLFVLLIGIVALTRPQSVYAAAGSVTDSYTDTSKINTGSSTDYIVSGGQLKISLKSNGLACSAGSECNSAYCVDSVCCNTACTGSTCQICNSNSNAGAGTCGYISTAVDPDNECGALDCDGGATKYYSGWSSNVCYYKADVSAADAVCTGTSLACKTTDTQCTASTQGLTSGVTRTACKTQVDCTGTTIGSLGNVAASSDTYSDCASYGCTSKVYGWSGLNCTAAAAGANDGDCNGAGACYTSFADSCTSGGSTLASCGSAGCQKAGVCVQNTASTTSDTVAEICYTSYPQSCSSGYTCNSTGTCVVCHNTSEGWCSKEYPGRICCNITVNYGTADCTEGGVNYGSYLSCQ